MSDLQEFAMNLPMVGVDSVGGAELSTAPVDLTFGIPVPAEVNQAEHKHISAYVDSATMTTYDPESPTVGVDLVMTVNVTDGDSKTSTFKVVKRLSMDKIKLALQAENQTPVQVVEIKDPAIEAAELAAETKRLAEAQAKKRARELAGLA